MRAMQQRYEELALKSALSRRSDYAQACNELAAILKGGFKVSPKRLQANIFEDVREAIRFVPELETMHELSAVNGLVQTAESVLPRQKKALVLSEFKHAAVVQQRRQSKCRGLEAAPFDVSRDILVHTFQFLDARSLGRAALVCRLWNVAASDESLWHVQYLYHFGESNPGFEKIGKAIERDKGRNGAVLGKPPLDKSVSWKRLFRETIKRYSFWWYKSNRVFCMTCDSFGWLKSDCRRSPVCSFSGSLRHKLKPLVPVQVLQLVLKDSLTSSSSSSSSDSDSDNQATKLRQKRVLKLWSFPKSHLDIDVTSDELEELSATLEKVSCLQLG